VTGETYPATPYLRCIAADKQWQGHLVRDRHGQPYALVAVHVGPTWTDAVAVEAEDRCVAICTRTNEDALILPTEPPDGSGVVWRRDGRCEDVLAELLELQQERPQ